MRKCSEPSLAKKRVLRNGKTMILVVRFIHMISEHLICLIVGKTLTRIDSTG
ncbi:uncharacterized protein METZ01_LOCUS460122 [marine metagenome]|uniref:Uncharacterized protein n=1 Tax=marine metagenome TaxID=408172 RepID=A0A383AJJ3_9ZZZZ